MSATITIQLSPSAIALADKFKKAPTEVPQAIKRGMTRSLQIVAGRIRLTGVGPFPVAEHRLGERSGQLKLRTRATEATITSEEERATITGAIGSSVKYAAVHEFGFDGEVTVRSKKGATHTRHMHMPERAPFRTGIRENAAYISNEIEKEIVKSLNP